MWGPRGSSFTKYPMPQRQSTNSTSHMGFFHPWYGFLLSQASNLLLKLNPWASWCIPILYVLGLVGFCTMGTDCNFVIYLENGDLIGKFSSQMMKNLIYTIVGADALYSQAGILKLVSLVRIRYWRMRPSWYYYFKENFKLIIGMTFFQLMTYEAVYAIIITDFLPFICWL